MIGKNKGTSGSKDLWHEQVLVHVVKETKLFSTIEGMICL